LIGSVRLGRVADYEQRWVDAADSAKVVLPSERQPVLVRGEWPHFEPYIDKY